MKKLLTLLLLTTFFVGISFAQDTVVVEPGYNTLFNAVNDNTTPGTVFRLKRGGVYTNDKAIEIKYPAIISGEKEPYETPPALLNMYADPGDAAGKNILSIYADFKIEYCGLVGYSVLDEMTNAPFKILKSDLDFTVDHCTIQSAHNVYWAGKDSLNLLFTNNIFWGIYWENWWGYGYMGNWGGNHVTHRLINNTFIGIGRYIDALNVGPEGTEEINHNTVVNTHGKIDFDFNTRNEIVTNNIFFDIRMAGYVGRRDEWGYPGDADNDSVFVDTLDGVVYIDSIWGCLDFEPLSDVGIDDYSRDIRVNNNLRYTSDDLLAYMKDITASWHPFIRPYYRAMMDKYGWEFKDNILDVVENGNDRVSGTDPKFLIDPTTTDLRKGYDLWNIGFRDSTRRGDLSLWPPFPVWYPTNPATGEPFKRYELIWPITDFLNFKPTNEEIWAAGDDGFPLGDLNWFDPSVIEAWENGLKNPLAVDEKQPEIPVEYALEQNFPNPFNPTTKISYSIPVAGNVTLKVYNAIGQEVATLVNKDQAPGNYSINFDASHLTSGVYLYRIKVNNYTASKKMLLLK